MRPCSGRRCALCRSKAPNSKRHYYFTARAISLIRRRSSLISSIRTHFAEFGIVASRGVRDVDRLLQILTDSDTRLPELARVMLGILADQLRDVAARVRTVEAQLLAWHRSNDISRRLTTIPGIGPITASAIAATVVDAQPV